MLTEKTSRTVKRKIRINPRGRMIKTTTEVYTHPEIPCGYPACENCRTPRAVFDSSQPLIAIPSFDIIHGYFDCIFNAQLPNMLISQSTVEKLKETSEQIFKRFKNVVNLEKFRNIFIFPNEFSSETAVPRVQDTSASDHYHAAERRMLKFYTQHLADYPVKLVYITNDQKLVVELQEAGLTAMPLFAFVRQFCPKQEELRDFIGFSEGKYGQFIEENPELGLRFTPHIPPQQLQPLVFSGALFRGKIKFNRTNPEEARVFSWALGREILIRGVLNTNRTLEGDFVAVELLDQSQWVGAQAQSGIGFGDDVNDAPDADEERQKVGESEGIRSLKERLKDLTVVPTGRVVGIVKRDLRNFAGEITREARCSDKEVMAGLVTLADARLPNILILSSNLSLLSGKKIIVTIDNWPETSRYPYGRCIKILGDAGNVGVENDAILFEFNIETVSFSQRVLDCLPNESEYPALCASEAKKRWDIRDYNVCSVDPPGCKDIDDALHCREVDANTWEAGVHIADVSFFVKPNTALDQEAANRCTTVYLVDRRTDMLPKLLTEKLCSLVGGEERLAFSVFWLFDPKTGNIKGTRFGRTLIKSKKAYSYQMAQERIDDASDQTELTMSLRRLMHLSKIVKNKRLEAGALQLASTQVKFKMDEESNPTDVSYYDLRETNSMVEEFMLLANVAVAEKITDAFPALAILRRHTTPKPEMIKQLASVLGSLGHSLDYSNSKSLAQSLDQISRPNDPFFNTLVRIMTTRCMNEATYFCSADFDPSEYRHYGLAADLYTHFTSPIRRYADVLVHRLLAAALDIDSLPDNMCNKNSMNLLCDRMNMRNRNARNASRASSEFFSYLFFKDKVLEEEGIVSALQTNGFGVTIVKYGFEAFIEYDKDDTVANTGLETKGINPLIQFFHKGRLKSLFDWVKVRMTCKLVNYRKVVTLEVIG